MAKIEYVEVYTTNGQLEADMIRLMLEANGLHVITRQESAGAVYGLTVGPLGEVKILVPENEAAEAINLLEAMEEGKLDKDIPGEVPSGNVDEEEIE